MYSTSSDKMNHHGRTGSHATKPSARGVIHDIPWWAEPVVREVTPPVKPPLDQRIADVRHRLNVRTYAVRKRLKAAHASGNHKEMEKAQRFLKRLCRIRRGVIDQEKHYNADV